MDDDDGDVDVGVNVDGMRTVDNEDEDVGMDVLGTDAVGTACGGVIEPGRFDGVDLRVTSGQRSSSGVL